MTAATQNLDLLGRQYLRRKGRGLVAAATTIYQHTLVAVNSSGYLVPAANTAGLRVVGMAMEKGDNSSGSNGDVEIEYAQGIFKLNNHGTNSLAQADVGRIAYVVDDNVVGDERGGYVVVAGRVAHMDPDSSSYAWVEVGLDGGALQAAYEGTIETVTSGALSLYTRTSLISVTGTAAYTLADGLYEGQRKSIIVTVAASTPDGTLTPATFADGTSIDLDAVLESVELEWHDTGGWRVIMIVTATINA